MQCDDVIVKERRRMMWHGDHPSARWFFADVIEIEIRKRECSDIHVHVCMSSCALPRIEDSKLI